MKNLVVMDKGLILYYILEPNIKIYYVRNGFSIVYCSEDRSRAFVFDSRDDAINMVNEIKKVTDCEFLIEGV